MPVRQQEEVLTRALDCMPVAVDGAQFMARRVALQACEAARKLPLEDLDPPRVRPQTSAAVARRLIGAALHDPTLRDKVTGCLTYSPPAAGEQHVG